MPYLAFEERWIDVSPLVATAAQVPEPLVARGLLHLAQVCVMFDRARYADMLLASAFGPDIAPKVRPALVACGVIAEDRDGWWPTPRPKRLPEPVVREREAKSPVVYFVRAPGGLVKIGFTSRIGHRIGCLQTGQPAPLELLASLPGTRPDERRLHTLFAAARRTGEWFEATPDLLAYIEKARTLGRLH
jgi:hypothetical protein